MKNDNASWEAQTFRESLFWVPSVDPFSFRFLSTAKWHFSPIFRIRNACHCFNQFFISGVTVGEPQHYKLQQIQTWLWGSRRWTHRGHSWSLQSWLTASFTQDRSWGATMCSPLSESLPARLGGLLCPWHSSSRSGPTWTDADLWSGGSSKEGLLFGFQI